MVDFSLLDIAVFMHEAPAGLILTRNTGRAGKGERTAIAVTERTTKAIKRTKANCAACAPTEAKTPAFKGQPKTLHWDPDWRPAPKKPRAIATTVTIDKAILASLDIVLIISNIGPKGRLSPDLAIKRV